ncbi:hypothetical protein CLV78_12121 [Aliiruegeria haliotis]|uniref:Glyoxalase/Bleomycin resistance-like N-terminal domain-containing protein n=1 Tax=Aliiruegeria haliotis TaxID=1280846 RepID=A0A2T0REF0_9RHOB|nr:VOC family protein [Aliiruegeria haliotis]PRY19532.1 hypothetical protein CLV78_12121 [Aliiruegeria haliotis]
MADPWPALVPELAVTDWKVSRDFYRDALGFTVAYERPDEGFACLRSGDAVLMVDQIGLGRTFVPAPFEAPLGRGINLQIRVARLGPILGAIGQAGIAPFLPLEENW